MIVHQLDLFGGPLKPPKKIKVDDEVPVEEARTLVEEEQRQPVEEAYSIDNERSPYPGTEEVSIEEDGATAAVIEEDDRVENSTPLSAFEADNVQEDGMMTGFSGDAFENAENDGGNEIFPGNTEDEFLQEAVKEEDIPLADLADEPAPSVKDYPGETSSIHVERPAIEEKDTSPRTEVGGTPAEVDVTDEEGEIIAENEEETATGKLEPAEEEEEIIAEPAALDEEETEGLEELEEVTVEETQEINVDINEEPIAALADHEAVASEETVEEEEEVNEAALETEQHADEPAKEHHERRGKKTSQEYEFTDAKLNVPPDEQLFKRQYYNMRETAAMFGVNQSLLRFWENEFNILQPKKNKKGDRYFRPVDVKNLVLIYHLLRVRKFTMEGAKEYLQAHKNAGDRFELVCRLEKLKSFLLELKATF